MKGIAAVLVLGLVALALLALVIAVGNADISGRS